MFILYAKFGTMGRELKTLWRPKQSRSIDFLCPLCRTRRRLPQGSNPRLRHWSQLVLTTFVLVILLWEWAGPKSVLLFFPLATLFEFIFRMKARTQLPCPHCGFDPYLALQSETQAKSEIEAFWKKKFKEKGVPYPSESPSLSSVLGSEVPTTSRKKQNPEPPTASFS